MFLMQVVDSVGTETKDPESLDMAAVSAETQESLEMLVCTEPIQGEGVCMSRSHK